ncbi:MAG: hypothetical protein AB8W37_11290 [Arsenophonus endosymbiont of Dermacentor nuttalli]
MKTEKFNLIQITAIVSDLSSKGYFSHYVGKFLHIYYKTVLLLIDKLSIKQLTG